MARQTKDIQLTSYNDLLGIEEESINKVVDIPLTELFSFKDHPFKVLDDAKMQETVESINEYGVLVPGLARPRTNGGYEIVAGHRRKRGCELASKISMPFIVKNYTDDEATIVMVDSNIQRENLLPSEKAFAYKMKLQAIKHQGVKGEYNSAELVGKNANDSGRTVQRYIRLTELIPELLDLVDNGAINITSAVNLSYLAIHEQEWVSECIINKEVSLSESTAKLLKKSSEEKKLTEFDVETILCNKKKGVEVTKVTLSETKIKKYFPTNYSKKQIEEIIYELLEEWKKVN